MDVVAIAVATSFISTGKIKYENEAKQRQR